MRTRRSISTARRVPSSSERPRCSIRTSAIWSPIVNTGLSEVIGSWKIMEMASPRILRISASESSSKSRIERVAHAVAKEVHREHGQRQADTGKKDEVARNLNHAPAFGHDVAPAWNIRRRTGADERQDRFGDHRRTTHVRSLHEER